MGDKGNKYLVFDIWFNIKLITALFLLSMIGLVLFLSCMGVVQAKQQEAGCQALIDLINTQTVREHFHLGRSTSYEYFQIVDTVGFFTCSKDVTDNLQVQLLDEYPSEIWPCVMGKACFSGRIRYWVITTETLSPKLLKVVLWQPNDNASANLLYNRKTKEWTIERIGVY